MKNLVQFLALAFLLPVWLRAQPQYTASNYASPGDTVYLTKALPSGYDFTISGSGVIWAYDSLIGQSQRRLVFASPTQTGFTQLTWPFVFNANNTNLASSDGRNRQLSAQNLTISSVWDYFRKSSTDLLQTANSYQVQINGVPVTVRNSYGSPDRLYRFPLLQGTEDSSTSFFVNSIPGTFFQSQTLFRKNRVDSRGTILTPAGFFENALRVVSDVVQTDSFVVNGNPIPASIRRYRELKWLHPSRKYPVLTVTQVLVGNAWVNSEVEYLDFKQSFAPEARFAYSPLAPRSGQPVSFQNLSLNASQFGWNFGDSDVPLPFQSTEENPQHTFAEAGTYLVRLIAFGETGTDTTVLPVIVLPSDTSTVVANPVILPGTGTYADPINVTLSCPTPNAQIYYTTSGNVPVIGTSFTRLYSGPFPVIQNTTIRAMAVRSDLPGSAVVVAQITITNPGICAAPVVSPGSGSYEGAQTITLSTSTPGAAVYYTTNGNLPRTDIPNSFTRLYTGPFLINASTTIRAMAVKSGILNSTVTVANLTITNPTALASAPSITPGSGVFTGPQTVSIGSATPGATLYYTTNGMVPRLDIPNFFTRVYTGPFTVNSTTTVRAIAAAPGFLPSPVSVAALTITGGRQALDQALSGLTVYPNPSSGRFSVTLPTPAENGEMELEVLNSAGRRVWMHTTESAAPVDIPLGGQPAGLYLLRIRQAGMVEIHRLVIR